MVTSALLQLLGNCTPSAAVAAPLITSSESEARSQQRGGEQSSGGGPQHPRGEDGKPWWHTYARLLQMYCAEGKPIEQCHIYTFIIIIKVNNTYSINNKILELCVMILPRYK